MTLAVLAFLREKEPELFKGTTVDVSKGLLAGELKEFDIYDELVAQFKTTKKKNAKNTKKKTKKRKRQSGMKSFFEPKPYLAKRTTTTTTSKIEEDFKK